MLFPPAPLSCLLSSSPLSSFEDVFPFFSPLAVCALSFDISPSLEALSAPAFFEAPFSVPSLVSFFTALSVFLSPSAPDVSVFPSLLYCCIKLYNPGIRISSKINLFWSFFPYISLPTTLESSPSPHNLLSFLTKNASPIFSKILSYTSLFSEIQRYCNFS